MVIANSKENLLYGLRSLHKYNAPRALVQTSSDQQHRHSCKQQARNPESDMPVKLYEFISQIPFLLYASSKSRYPSTSAKYRSTNKVYKVLHSLCKVHKPSTCYREAKAMRQRRVCFVSDA